MRITKFIAMVVFLGPEWSVDAVAVTSEVPNYSLGLLLFCIAKGKVCLATSLKREPYKAGSFD